MKKSKIFLMALIGILYFCITVQGFNTFSIEQDDKDNKNIVRFLPISNSVVIKWDNTWGGPVDDVGCGVVVDSSDNVYLAGETDSFGAGNKDLVLVKYDSSGSQQWYRTWGGSDNEYIGGVAMDSSNNVYLAGYTSGAGKKDMVLVKYDSFGTQLWNRTRDGSSNEEGLGVAVDSSDNVYLVGWIHVSGLYNYNMALVKYNSSGAQLWSRTWGGSSYDWGRGVAVDSSDYVYITGDTESFGEGNLDMVLVKYNSSGAQLWNRTWGGSVHEYGRGVAVDSSDNVYITGGTDSFGVRERDMVLVKYDSSGAQQWYRTWDGSIDSYRNKYYDEAWHVAVDSSDNIYLSGRTWDGVTYHDLALVKYDSSGTQQWDRIWGGSDYDGGRGTAVDSSDNVYLAGYTESYGAGESDMVLVKYGKDVTTPIITIINPQNNEVLGATAPNFDITIVEPNLDKTWYSINGGTNITFTGLDGTINEVLWNSLPEGNVVITFYANDTLGRTGFQEVTVVKEIAHPDIPGYNVFFLLEIISIVTIIVIKKKLNH
ncbi:MAG TPA: hypothetical protein ENH75_00710 [archaeon]|nr:hypothetical protein [archaeon]